MIVLENTLLAFDGSPFFAYNAVRVIQGARATQSIDIAFRKPLTSMVGVCCSTRIVQYSQSASGNKILDVD